MSEPLVLTEMDFGRTDERMDLAVESHAGGDVRVVVTDGYDHATYTLTLQQAIQLRDFLNRHIDTLALAGIGASTERSSDDPTQLPSEHMLAIQEGLADAEKGRMKSLDEVRAQFIAGHRSERG